MVSIEQMFVFSTIKIGLFLSKSAYGLSNSNSSEVYQNKFTLMCLKAFNQITKCMYFITQCYTCNNLFQSLKTFVFQWMFSRYVNTAVLYEPLQKSISEEEQLCFANDFNWQNRDECTLFYDLYWKMHSKKLQAGICYIKSHDPLEWLTRSKTYEGRMNFQSHCANHFSGSMILTLAG